METQNIIYTKKTCPWGEKAIDLLDKEDVNYETHYFKDKNEEKKFKEKYDVSTTPQVFLEGERVGGYEELAKKYDENVEEEDKTSYIPVFAVFSIAFLLSLVQGLSIRSFMGFSLVLLSLLKLMDLKSFKQRFLQYDLVSQKIDTYAYLYPFLELVAGLGFLANKFHLPIGSISALIGLLGSVSVFNAVYIQKRDLNCACVGGDTDVPLGAISFTENLMMLIMGVLFIFRY